MISCESEDVEEEASLDVHQLTGDCLDNATNAFIFRGTLTGRYSRFEDGLDFLPCVSEEGKDEEHLTAVRDDV